MDKEEEEKGFEFGEEFEELLKGEKIRLKQWKLTYAKQLSDKANNLNVSRYLLPGFPYPYTLSDAENYIQNHLKGFISPNGVCFAIILTKNNKITTSKIENPQNNQNNQNSLENCEISIQNHENDEDVVIGGIGLHFNDLPNSFNGPFGYWIAEEHWRKGYASEAIYTFLHFIYSKKFEEMTSAKINLISASVFNVNFGSKKTLEKLKFEKGDEENIYVDRFGVNQTSTVYYFSLPLYNQLYS